MAGTRYRRDGSELSIGIVDMKPRISLMTIDDAQGIMDTFGIEVTREPKRMNSGVANASFLVSSNTDLYVMSILENHTPKSAQYLNEINSRLVEVGVRTPPVLVNKDRVQVFEFRDYPLVVRPFVEGHEANPRSSGECEAVGMELAVLHLRANKMPEGDYSRRLPTDWRSKIATCDDSEFLDWVTVVSNRFISECDGLPVGFTHGDLFPDNVMVTSDGNAMLLDWETASHEVLVYDLAIAVIGFMLTSIESGLHLVRGYESRRKLSDKERLFFAKAFDYGCVVLAFHRFLRHNVLYPGTGRETAYRHLYEWYAKLSASEVQSILG